MGGRGVTKRERFFLGLRQKTARQRPTRLTRFFLGSVTGEAWIQDLLCARRVCTNTNEEVKKQVASAAVTRLLGRESAGMALLVTRTRERKGRGLRESEKEKKRDDESSAATVRRM
jgi:hypothetical protein